MQAPILAELEPADTTQQLLDKRYRVLKTIHHLQHSSDHNPSALRDLTASFNSIVSNLDALNTSSLLDPLDILPPELWEAIFRDAATDSTRGFDRIATDEVLIYTLVSKKWQWAILSTSSFWTDIHIAAEVRDLADKVHLGVQLSGNLPLTLFLADRKAGSWEQVAPYIIPQSFRLQSIKLVFRDPILYNPLLPFLYLRGLTSLVSIESRHVFEVQGSADWNSFLQRTGSLKSLKSIKISEETINFDSLKHLQTLSTFARPECLPTLDALREVSLEQLMHGIYDEDSDNSDTKYNISVANASAPLQWQSLRFFLFRYPSSLVPLLRRTASTLVSLAAVTPWSNLMDLLSICSSMPLLRSLNLSLQYTEEHNLRLQPLPAPKIHFLQVYMTDMPFSQQTFDGDKPSIRNMAILFEFFVSWAPYLHELEVRAAFDQPEIMLYVEGLKNLSRFRTWFKGFGPSSEHTIQLHSHNFEFVGPYSTLQRFRGPNVSSLRVFFDDATSYPRIDSILTTDRWKNLRYLIVTTPPRSWKGISFPLVRKIKLGSTFMTIFDTGSISSLCEQIALNPTIFPALESLESAMIPEWDILMIMLERRNCSLDSGLTRITSLSFRALPPPFIARPLTQLLRGELPSYSFLDYSLVAISPIYFDLSTSVDTQILYQCETNQFLDQDACVAIYFFFPVAHRPLESPQRNVSLNDWGHTPFLRIKF